MKYSQKREDRMLEQRTPIAWYKVMMWVLLPCFAAFSTSGIVMDVFSWVLGWRQDPVALHVIVYLTMGTALIFTIYTFYNMYVMKSYRMMLAYIFVLPAMIILNKILPLLIFPELFGLGLQGVTASIVTALLFLSVSLLYFPRRKLLFDDMHYRYIDYHKEHPDE